MAITYYKGFIGQEDIELGTGVFNRYDSNGNPVQKTQLNKGVLPRKVQIKTAAYTINPNTEAGEKTYTNEGAIASVTFTLPVAKAGLGKYTFVVTDAQTIVVEPNGAELFRDCAAGKNKSTNAVGNRLSVWCDVDGTWEYEFALVSGNWTNEA